LAPAPKKAKKTKADDDSGPRDDVELDEEDDGSDYDFAETKPKKAPAPKRNAEGASHRPKGA
jgi:hypothetical protein